MKRYALCALVLLAALATDGYCQDPARKISRGIANIVMSPFEIPKTVTTTYCDEQGVPESILIGIPKGVAKMVERCAVGIYETVTFPFPVPGDYRPVMEPEFLWDSSRQ